MRNVLFLCRIRKKHSKTTEKTVEKYSIQVHVDKSWNDRNCSKNREEKIEYIYPVLCILSVYILYLFPAGKIRDKTFPVGR